MSTADPADPAELPPPRWSPLALTILLAIPLIALFAHLLHYIPFIADDALISHRYAQRLITGHGLTWTAGPPVEGYSNLLWLLLHAALGLVGVDLIDASRILGFACGVLIVWSLIQLHPPPAKDPARATTSTGPALAILAGGVSLAACGPIAVWTIGGLEQPLVAALVAWALVRARPLLDGETLDVRESIRAGLPLGLLCLTRPDSPLIAAMFGLAVLLTWGVGQRAAWRSALALGVWPLACTLAQLGFRLVYYGDWVPNTAHLKARWTRARLDEGIDYVLAGLESAVPLILLAGVAIVAAVHGHRRGRVVLLILIPLAWLSYVASVGGDIFPAYRHLVVAFLCLALLAAEGVAWAADGLGPRRALAWGLVIAGLDYGLVQMQRSERANQRAIRERWEWDGEVMGPVFRDSFGERDPLMAVTAAGSLPYFSGLRALDMQGINDRHIARQPPAKGMIGHDHGDGAYVLEQQPDFMVFGQVIGGRPKFVSGRQLRDDPRFERDYWLVHFEGFNPRRAESNAWVRLDGKLGLVVGDDRIEIPPYLLAGSAGQQVGGSHMGARLLVGEAASSPPITLEPGRWAIELEPAGLPIELRVTHEDRGRARVLASPGNHPAIEADERTTITLSLVAVRADTPITHLRLVRAPPTGKGRVVEGDEPTILTPAEPGEVREVEAIGRFDQGWDGWTVYGRSFAAGPSEGRVGRQKRVRGHVGPLLNSYGPDEGDEATGRATSPSFVAGADQVLSFGLGGGDRRGINVLLVSEDGRALMAWTGNQSTKLEPIRYELGTLAGQTLHLEVIDASTRSWGHVLVDEVEILHY